MVQAGPANPSALDGASRRTVSSMSTVEQQRDDLAHSAIFDWRLSELTRAGYSPADAWLLASDTEVDLRAAERLLAQGCPASTALRILL